MNVRELTPADMDAAVAFAHEHFSHPLALDDELRKLSIRRAIVQQTGLFFVAENEGGFQAIVHCLRQEEEPPFANRYYLDVIAADRERDGKQALDALLTVITDKAVVEAGVSPVIFYAFCDAEDTVVENALRDAGFGKPWRMEMGRTSLEMARELPVPEGISVRLATTDDAARISEMTIALTHPVGWTSAGWVVEMVETGAKLFLAESEGRIVAVCGGQMVRKGKAIGLFNMVEKDYQGKGIGSYLYHKFCVEFRKMGVQKSPGFILSEKHRRFYEQVGFEHVKDIIVWERTVEAA